MEETLCLRNVNVVDVEAGEIHPSRSVLIQDGLIKRIQQGHAFDGIRGLDCRGGYLNPGLIDCHAHFFLDSGGQPRESYLEADDATRAKWARRNASTAIRAGITTMRDCAAPAPLMFALKREIDAGQIEGPHILTCGHALMRPGGHCHWIGGGEVTTTKQVQEAVESLLNQGAGFVKLMASGGGLTPGTFPHEADFSLDLMEAAVEVAHANGVQVTAHCHSTESMLRAIEAGLDMIEHASFLNSSGRYQFEPRVGERIRDSQTVVCPTVLVALRTAQRFRQVGRPHNPADVAAIDRLEGRLINTREFHRLGIDVVGGTDCGATNTAFDSLVDEILLYTEAGFSNLEALRTVTNDSARLLSLGKMGEVKEGYQADLLLVTSNPLESVSALKRPRLVIKSGRLAFDTKAAGALEN